MDENQEIAKKIYIKPYRLLKCFGLWNLIQERADILKQTYKLYGRFLMFWMMIFNFFMGMQVATHLDDIDEVIQVFFLFATTIAVLGKWIGIKTKQQLFENHFKRMMSQKFLPADAKEQKILKEYADFGEKVNEAYKYMSLTSLTFYFITLYSNENHTFPVNLYNPIEINANWKYNMVYLCESMTLTFMGLINVGFDTLATGMMLHLKAQLEMLGHRLENIGSKANNVQDVIYQELQDCSRYYNRILVFTHDIENLISIPISLQIACTLFVLIANFYAMSSLSDLDDPKALVKFGLYLSCMMTQIFMLCYFPNEVYLKSSELSFHIYSSDWYNWNKANRKMALLMMIRFDNPIHIHSINSCYSLNLAAFTSIVNTSYSYFALLRRVNRE